MTQHHISKFITFWLMTKSIVLGMINIGYGCITYLGTNIALPKYYSVSPAQYKL